DVVATAGGIGSASAPSRTSDVDDVGVVRTDVVDVDAEALADARPLVGEEDVRDRREAVEDGAPFVGAEVEADAALPAVGVLEQDVHHARKIHDAGAGKAAHRVTALD